MVTSKKTLAAALVLILLRKKKKKRDQKRLWVRKWIQQREIEDTANTLIEDLKNEEGESFK